jgi:hypothetical protein
MKKLTRTKGFRVYRTPGDRKRAIAMLRRAGCNYFVCYRDVAGLGLSFGVAEWVTHERGPEGVYINW